MENTSRRLVFSTFLECSQMSAVFFFHSVIHGLGFVIKTIEHAFSVFYLALINRAGGLYGRILTEVVSTDRLR